MGGFFAPPPNPDAPVPPGQDYFDVPPPSFRLIGQAVGQGLKDAGAVTSTAGSWLDWLPKALALMIGYVLGKLLGIIAYLIGLINTMYEGADPGIDAIAKASLEHVFQINAGGGPKRALAPTTDTAGAAAALGQTIINALAGGLNLSAGGTIQPSLDGSEAFLGKVARIGIEGWVEGTIGELLTVGQVKAAMELVPLMAQVLGLGRMTRRVVQPLLKIGLADPATWYLNKQYRPTLLPEANAVRQFLRGKMDANQLDDALGRLGYSPTAIAAIVNLNTKHLSLGDLDYLVSRNHWSIDQAAQELQNDGYDQATANNLLNLAQQRRIDQVNQKLLDAQIAAYERGDIDQAALHDAIAGADIPDGEKAILEAAEVMIRALNVRHLSLGEVQSMVKAHIMSLDDVRAWMTRENFPPDEQTFLELYLMGKITSADQADAAKKSAADQKAAAALAKQNAAAAKATAAAAQLAVKGVSTATFEQLVIGGQRTFAEYQTFLQQKGLSSSAIADVIDALHAKIDKQQAAQKAHDALVAESDQKHVPLATVEKNVENGSLTIGEMQTWMQGQEYTADDIALATSYVQAQLDRVKAKAAIKSGATKTAAAKGISLPNLERAARLGLTTTDAYGQALTAAGFDQESVDLMVGILNSEIAADTAAIAKQQAAAAKAAQRNISLAQLEQAVIAGIQPMTAYSSQLSLLGFSPDDIATLVQLLQLRVDNAAAVAKTHAAAAAKLAQRQISLADLERMVKLGVLTPAEYTAQLAAQGFSDADQQLLVSALLAELQQTKAAQQKAAAASSALKTKGISLAAEQALVKAGIQTLDGYTAWLTQQGYAAGDAANLTQLLSLELEQAKAADALHAAAQAKAADKDISLAAEERAVVDGIRSIDDYQALLADLGYNEVDQATLVALLEQKLGAAAAKAAPQP